LEVVEWIDVALVIGLGADFHEHNCANLSSKFSSVFFSTAVIPLAPFPTVISPGSEADHQSPFSVR
jgi:hypothetical protein